MSSPTLTWGETTVNWDGAARHWTASRGSSKSVGTDCVTQLDPAPPPPERPPPNDDPPPDDEPPPPNEDPVPDAGRVSLAV